MCLRSVCVSLCVKSYVCICGVCVWEEDVFFLLPRDEEGPERKDEPRICARFTARPVLTHCRHRWQERLFLTGVGGAQGPPKKVSQLSSLRGGGWSRPREQCRQEVLWLP